jgi:hypothetical protein
MATRVERDAAIACLGKGLRRTTPGAPGLAKAVGKQQRWGAIGIENIETQRQAIAHGDNVRVAVNR